LISSLGAMVQISLRRSRADWPIVASAGLICVLAATLLAAGSIYAGAVSIAGLQRVLGDAPATEANIAVSTRLTAGDEAAADAIVTAELGRAFEATGGTILRSARSGTFALPDQPTGEVRELAVLGYAEGIADHVTLTAGLWPDPTGTVGFPIPVAVSEDVASHLGLVIGDRLDLESRVTTGFAAQLEIAAVFRINDPADPFWWDEQLVTEGVTTSERFTTHGPFFAAKADLLAKAAPAAIEFGWHAFPDTGHLTVAGLGDFRARVGELDGRLDAALAGGANVETGLPGILTEADRSLLVSRTGVLLLTVQLVALAAYAVLLSASLLVEHRRVETAMIRSRGAGRPRIVGLALIEGLLLTVPAAMAAPWLAAAALRAFNIGGPLAEIGLTIEPEVTSDAYLAGAAAAVVCLIALTVPVFLTGRSISGVHGKVARGETAGIGQRLGLDLALVAVAAIGLWQLRHYGAPLTRSVQGTLGLDPLLVATPAIGLLAGAIVALRIIPLLAQLAERAAAGGRGLVPSLGSRQLARRPLRYTRAALLLMLAMAMGVFAVSYTWTWTASQHDQASFQVGADLRVEPGTQVGSMPRWALDHGLAGLSGVNARLPVDRESITVSRASGSGEILGLDPGVAPSVVALRADLSAEPLGGLLAPLAAARPTVDAVRLPGEPREIRMTVDPEIRQLERRVFDEAAGTTENEPADIREIAGWHGIAISIVVRDARGMLHRFGGPSVPIDAGAQEVVVPLGGASAGEGSFAYPLDVLAVELFVSLPGPYQTPDATVTLRDLAASGEDGHWRPAPLQLAGGWRSTVAFYGRPHQPVVSKAGGDELTAVAGKAGLPLLSSVDDLGRATVITFAPSAIGTVGDDPTPIVASQAFLDASASTVGDDLSLTLGGTRRDVRVVGSVRAFPATDPTRPVAIVDLATLGLLRFEASDAVEPADEWWLAVDDGTRTTLSQALADAPFRSRAVFSEVERGQSLATDPIALGIIGALAIGFVAAALFAVVGFIVSAAVSARERIAEFALLRALGLSSGQLSVWLSLENAALAAVSLVTGTVLGLVIAWVVLPFITVTQGAATPYPPVIVEVPWTVIGVLEAVGLLALGATVVALAIILPRIGLAAVLRMSED
jgi:FtsX-like permease family